MAGRSAWLGVAPDNVPKLGGPAGPRPAPPKPPAMGTLRSIHPSSKLRGLASELQRLQHQSKVSSQQPGSIIEHLVAQVSILQHAFITLADGVLGELDTVRGEASRWQADRAEWLSNVRMLRQEANDKLLQVDRAQAEAAVTIQAAQAGVQAQVAAACQQLDSRGMVLESHVAAARVDMQMLRNAVKDMQTLTSSDFPNEMLRQRVLDKHAIEAAIDQSIQGVVPVAVARAVAQEAPSVVRQQVAAELRHEVGVQLEPFKRELKRATDQVSSDVGSMALEVATLAGAVESLSSRSKALETGSADAEARLRALEAQALPSAAGLHDRVEQLSSQQVRFAHSMEEVVRAVVDEASSTARTVAAHSTTLAAHAAHLRDTREGLMRSATMFATLLGVPTPVNGAAPSAVLDMGPAANPRSTSTSSLPDLGMHGPSGQPSSTFLGIDLSEELTPSSLYDPPSHASHGDE